MEDKRLIEAVREFPCLWRVSSRAYKDLRTKENAWKEICKQLDGVEVEECQKRWKQLRDKYVREKKKTKGKSGDAGPATISCWPLYEVLDFLRETVKHKSTVTNFQRSHTSTPTTGSTSRESSPIEASETELEMSVSQCNNSSCDIQEIPTQTLQLDTRERQHLPMSSGPSNPKSTKRKRVETDSVDTLLLSQVQKLTAEQDEASSFGEHVAARLRTFTPRQRAMACVQIDHVLFDIEFPNEQMNLLHSNPHIPNEHGFPTPHPSTSQIPFTHYP